MGSHRRTAAAAAATILASLSLYPIFLGTAWFFAGAGAVCAVAVAGTLTRLRRLPVAVCVAGVLAGLLLYLNVTFEAARSWGDVVPTPTSLRLLWDLAGAGFTESAKYAPAVPELPGMMLLAAGGIGLTALLTDLIAVRLESAALGGLPLLLLYTEPFTLSVSRSALGTTITFCLGTAGYLGLLSSEGRDRIREWERPNPGPDLIPDTRALAAAGRRVGIASVALALCLPLFVPGLHVTRLFGGQPGIGGTAGAGGGAGVGFPNPNTQLSQELHETQAQQVFEYTTSDSAAEYFQIYVLDHLTSSGWQLTSPSTLAPAGQRLPAPPGLAEQADKAWATTVRTNVTLSPAVGQDALSALPVPYPATAITAPGDLKADPNTLMVFDYGVQLADLTYAVTSLSESPTPQALNAAAAPPPDIAGPYLQVPSSYDSLRRLAKSIVKAAGAKTPFEEALALQDYFTGGAFTYTLDAPTVTDAQQLTAFLTRTYKGYCQQFAFAMAVLARLLGIPSRVAYGFTGGTSVNGVYVVTTHDAHAWPELYFQGFGWLRFEPTPQGAGGQGTATSPSYTLQPSSAFPTGAGQTSPGSGKTPSSLPGSGSSLQQRLGLQLGNDNGGGPAPVTPATLSPWQVLGLALLALLGLLVLASAAPACARLVIRRRRWRAGARGGDAGLAHAAWRELRDDLVDYRAGFSPSESPRALAARVGPELELTGPAMTALRHIAMAEERARYAARPDSGSGLRQDSATVRRAIAAAVPRGTRWLARVLPSSVLTPTMIRLSQAADFLGRLNPELPGRAGLSGTRLGGVRFSRKRPDRAHADEANATSGSKPPVAAGTRG